MTDEKQQGNFWTTLPGILTGIGGVIGGLAALVTAFESYSKSSPTTTTNPSNTPTASSKTEELTVPADSTKGVEFPNKEGKYVKVNFTTSGTWLAIPKNISDPRIPDSAKGFLSAKGATDFRSNDQMPCPRFPMGALVVTGNGCKASGDVGSFDLKPGETVYFKMNDTYYPDNDGSIQVHLSISE